MSPSIDSNAIEEVIKTEEQPLSYSVMRLAFAKVGFASPRVRSCFASTLRIPAAKHDIDPVDPRLLVSERAHFERRMPSTRPEITSVRYFDYARKDTVQPLSSCFLEMIT
jgi:hypothetical protein